VNITGGAFERKIWGETRVTWLRKGGGGEKRRVRGEFFVGGEFTPQNDPLKGRGKKGKGNRFWPAGQREFLTIEEGEVTGARERDYRGKRKKQKREVSVSVSGKRKNMRTTFLVDIK